METPLPPIKQYPVYLGCDPEFFFEKEGKIIGSENVFDLEKGFTPEGGGTNKFIVDGVQAELNPAPATCRENLANNISFCFKALHKKIASDPSLKVNFKATVEITKPELDKLDKKSKVFGCAPSLNAGKKKASKIRVNAKKYMYRSAGGHIHLGKYSEKRFTGEYDQDRNSIYKNVPTPEFDDPERLVTVLDILVGNTSVLIDRDEGNKIRRKVYGKAGEYRVPSYGVEYRTLSNFWLRSYPLMALVMGLSRMSAAILRNTTPETNYEKELLALVDMKLVRKAIDTNDFDMAYANWQKIKPFIAKYFTKEIQGSYYNTLHVANLDAFEHFVKKGIDYWFKEDAFTHWVNLPRASANGFETFLEGKVRSDMDNDVKKPT